MGRAVVLVTGCSEGGIGYELCKCFAQRNCIVYATSRKVESMQGLEGYGIFKLQLDVTDPQSVRQAVAAVITSQGRIDVLVNNAGVGPACPVAEMDLKTAHALFDTNFFGMLDLTQQVLPIMTKQGHGKIGNIGSNAGYLSISWLGIYSASKAAVQSLSDALRLEVQPLGIQVMLVVAGGVQSNSRNTLKNYLMTDEAFRPDGPYAALKQNVIKAWGPDAEANASLTPTHKFADAVVEAAMRSRVPSHFSAGQGSWICAWARHLPLWMKDSMLLAVVKGLGQAQSPAIANKST